MYKDLVNRLNNIISKKYVPIIIILVASIFVSIPLLSDKLNMLYDDGVQHICRLMGTFQSIVEGQTFPVIMSNFANGFGYSWNLFYSPVTAYIPLIFKILGMSFTNCIKMFMFLVVFLSGLSMYFFTKKVTKNDIVSTLAAIIYIFAPYRLTDMYIRNAIAELTSFIFLPMVFMGIYNILNEKKNDYILAIGAIGLILTHLIIGMYTAIISFIYLLVNYKKLKDIEIIKKLAINILLIIVITSFFWAPLLEHKMATEYEVFKEGRMERTEVLVAYKLSFSELFVTMQNGGMIYEIGWVSIIGLVLTPIVIKKLKEHKDTPFYKMYLFSLISGLICLFMTLKIFPFEKLPAILKMLQFSFRLLEFSSFFLAFVVAVNIAVVAKKIKMSDVLILLVILMILTSFYVGNLHFLEEKYDENRLWPTVKVTKDTGRVHAGLASFEYLPSKAFENRSHIETRSQDVIVLEGNATIEKQEKENTNLYCELVNITEGTKIELPYIYYLGYKVTLNGNGEKINLKTFETEKGFIGVELPQMERGALTVEYKGTTIMKISTIISVIGICVLGYMHIKGRKKQI